MPVTKGRKSKKEQFAGADYTTTVEVRGRRGEVGAGWGASPLDGATCGGQLYHRGARV